jgi:signal transduction histidine kinase
MKKRPIEVIPAYLKTMDERQQETMRPMIHAIQTGVDRTMKLVKSLNHFNRHTESEKEECQVETIIDNCLNLLNYRLKYGINVHKDFTNTHYHCMANESQLHQVFLNIINNAAQAIDNNGDIWIKTELSKDQLQIKILDNGKGIARSDLKRIFDPFYTTKAPGEGTGLGLAISRKIILAHNGDIQIHSTPDKGTEVTITLPVSE